MQRFIRLGVALATVAVLAYTPSTAKAQSASITATAIVAGALTVTNQRNLDFGTVIPGFTRTVLPTDATSGHFQVDGGVNAEVQLTFSTLQTTLIGLVPANTLTAAYSATYNTADAGGTGTGFVPASGVTTRLGAAVPAQLHIYIGGVINVPGGQAADTYTGTITLDAAYTGN
ncbi:MAG: DUF4402 domain-containing protein [Gemmatimonadales bacterium]|nr:DUF4402 domain-containing protein [Gemmatimonadales bacterium]